MLVCPLCKGPLEAGHDPDGRLVELECPADKLAFPIHDGIPAMLGAGKPARSRPPADAGAAPGALSATAERGPTGP